MQAPSNWGGRSCIGPAAPSHGCSGVSVATPCPHTAVLPSACGMMYSSIPASWGSTGTGAQTDPPRLKRHRVCLDTSQLCHWLLSLSFRPYLFTRHVFRAQSDKEGRSAVGCPLKHCPLPLCRAALSPRDRLSPPRALQVTLRSVLPPPGAVGQEEEMTW